MSLPPWIFLQPPRIIRVRGFECRFVVVSLRRRGCYMLRLQCPSGRRWMFARLPFYACVSGRYEYCLRRDKTRNLIVESHKCVPIFTLPIVCIRFGSVLQTLAERLVNIIETAWEQAKVAVDECHEEFGVMPEQYGYYLSMEEYDVCQYNRCDQLGRLVYRYWRVEGASGFNWSVPEVEWSDVEQHFTTTS